MNFLGVNFFVINNAQPQPEGSLYVCPFFVPCSFSRITVTASMCYERKTHRMKKTNTAKSNGP